ncbi:hypothetical protein E2C01_042910 [Portunus trituberculatus]|uniref:Uncharacterized protein n=1 Tax=Portunus trituberculatus TaxID=210409 RepID=A0A5B7FU94_PORTR|nr:hypothetical protein [Portunus trituberculatus]
MISERRGKPKLVVYIDISKDGNLCGRVEGQNVLLPFRREARWLKTLKIRERGHKSKLSLPTSSFGAKIEKVGGNRGLSVASEGVSESGFRVAILNFEF